MAGMPPPRDALDALLTAAENGEPVDPAAAIRSLAVDRLQAIEVRAREELARLPVLIGRGGDAPVHRRRRMLDRVLATIDAQRGRPDRLLSLAREDWLSGGRHASYLRLLVEHGRAHEAMHIARALLERADGSDRTSIERVVRDAGQPPRGWDDAVRRFARSPSVASWDDLLRFIPEPVYELRLRHTLALLRHLDVEPEIIFRCAARSGITADAIELAEEGQVSPKVIEERARSSDPPVSGLWYGLAARAACVRGDGFSTVRLLRAMAASGIERERIDDEIRFVRSRADDELRLLLDRAGVPNA